MVRQAFAATDFVYESRLAAQSQMQCNKYCSVRLNNTLPAAIKIVNTKRRSAMASGMDRKIEKKKLPGPREMAEKMRSLVVCQWSISSPISLHAIAIQY